MENMGKHKKKSSTKIITKDNSNNSVERKMRKICCKNINKSCRWHNVCGNNKEQRPNEKTVRQSIPRCLSQHTKRSELKEYLYNSVGK